MSLVKAGGHIMKARRVFINLQNVYAHPFGHDAGKKQIKLPRFVRPRISKLGEITNLINNKFYKRKARAITKTPFC
jgi:hypothetical protein